MRDGAKGRSAVVAVALTAALLVTPAAAKVVRGGHADDRLAGTAKADTLDGRHGDDRLKGRAGGDLLIGGSGKDELIGGGGFDEMRGGGGDDVIDARDGEPDMIICGRGDDQAIVDPVEDGVFDCEEVDEP